MNQAPFEWPKSARDTGQKLATNLQKFFEDKGEGSSKAIEDLEASSAIAEAQEKHQAELLRLENVVGVADSFKITKNQPQDQRSLTVLVREKKAANKLSKANRVPAEIDGVPTDVVEVGDLHALVFNTRVRPALPGFSIGHHNITAGTFGCLVRDIRRCCCELENDSWGKPIREDCENDYLILSNNHVLADVNQAQLGDLILQPGPFDGGVFPADGVAELERFEPIVFGMSGYNVVDCAVARPTHTRNAVASIIGLVMPTGINQAFAGSRVVKAGRTTQVTTGTIIAVNATVLVNFGAAGVVEFRNQILTTAMAAGGDSGSLLMDANLNAIGLLFAGSAIITIHNHISNVEVALGVRPVTAPRSG